jgi:AcrR family transcriptional regulator
MSSEAMTGSADAASARTPRQADRVNKVLDAAVELLRESSYSELTVRDVAARAGVSPATAYNYFSSKNALIAEVYLRRVRSVPLFVDVNESVQTRVTQQLHELAVLVADEPEVAAATTTALMGGGEEVRHLREKIGWEVRRRITAALGPGEWPVVLTALELIFYGALVRAATSLLTYHQIADHLNEAVALLFKGIDEH